MARHLVALLCAASAVLVDADPTCRAGFQRVSEVSACLDAIPVSTTMRGAVSQALATLQELYAYTDLALDSVNNDAHFSSEWLSNGCERFPVHKSNLEPLEAQIAQMWQSETSLGRLWRAIGKYSVELRDAHSHVDPPWAAAGPILPGGVLSVLPFDFVVEPNNVVKLGCNWYANLIGSVGATKGKPEAGAAPIALSAQGIQGRVRCDDRLLAFYDNRTFDPDDSRDPMVGRTIQTVNGMPVIDYLHSVADQMGARRGASNRLNDFLGGIKFTMDGIEYSGQALNQPRSVSFPPEDGALRLVFDDGSKFDTAWTMYLGAFKDQTLTSLEIPVGRLQAHYERSSLLSFVDLALNQSRPDLIGCGTPVPSNVQPADLVGSAAVVSTPAPQIGRDPDSGRTIMPYEADPHKTGVSVGPGIDVAIRPSDDNACPARDPATEPGPYALFKDGEASSKAGRYLYLSDPSNCTWDLPSQNYYPAFPHGLNRRCRAKFPTHSVTWWYSPRSDSDFTPLTGATSIILLEPDEVTVPPTVTFKIESFSPREGTSTQGMQREAVFPQMEKAVELAHRYTNDKLLIDLTGNGGGVPTIASMMLEYFFGGDGPLFTPYGVECQWLSQPLPKLTKDWLRLLWNVEPHLAVVEQATGVALKMNPPIAPITYLDSTGVLPAASMEELINGLVTPYNRLDANFRKVFPNGVITYLALGSYNPTAQAETVQAACQDDSNAWNTQLNAYVVDLTRLALVGQCLKDGNSYLNMGGAFKFAPNATGFEPFGTAEAAPACGLELVLASTAVNPASGFILPSQGYPMRDQAIPATTSHYRQATPKSYGGMERDYSALFTHFGACPTRATSSRPDYLPPDVTEQPPASQTSLKHVTVISDGACGSSCAVFALPAYLSGKATFVTYGGFKGEPMDITSFNGGPVKAWSDLWPGLQMATLFLNAFATSMPAAATGQPLTFGPVDASRFAPMAGPTGANFIMSAGVAAQTLGPMSLPVEWYQISGSHHLDFHPRGPGSLQSATLGKGQAYTWCQIFSLYQSVDAMPAAPLTCAPRPTLSFSMSIAAAAASLGSTQQNAIKSTLQTELANLVSGVKLLASDIALSVTGLDAGEAGRRLAGQASSDVTVTITVPPGADEAKLEEGIRSGTKTIQRALVDAGFPVTAIQGPWPDDSANWFSEVGNAAFTIALFALTFSLASMIALVMMASKPKGPTTGGGSVSTPSAVTYSTERT